MGTIILNLKYAKCGYKEDNTNNKFEARMLQLMLQNHFLEIPF